MGFKAGDVVILKSGSHPMTVESVLGNGKVMCVWVHEGKFETYVFSPESLKNRG